MTTKPKTTTKTTSEKSVPDDKDHPVRIWIRSLTWDKKKRLSALQKPQGT